MANPVMPNAAPNPLALRRQGDVQKVRDLASRSGGRIVVTRCEGSPVSRVALAIHAVTAPSAAYPQAQARRVDVEVLLPARFPFEAPAARVTTPILHPNVWPGGNICLGATWLPTQGLDLLVRRIVAIVTFDPLVLNEASPANRVALEWYREARRRHPAAFPTDRLLEQLP